MTKKIYTAATLLLAFSVGLALSQDKGGKGGGKGPAGPGLTLTSPDIEDGAVIADKYTAKAGPAAVSPKLQWANAPAATQSFALLFHDPDVALQKKMDDVTHWMVFNIPGTATELPGGISADAKLADGTIQIKNTRGAVGYMGPGAPAAGPIPTPGAVPLDTKLDLTEAATALYRRSWRMDGHIPPGKGILAAGSTSAPKW
jgi:Raf kinase inhibitor-like YbhB/YbcL family protein